MSQAQSVLGDPSSSSDSTGGSSSTASASGVVTTTTYDPSDYPFKDAPVHGMSNALMEYVSGSLL